ncbi:ribosome biogenesis GTPase YlqF [Marinibactrum halimedae]|uniref:Ribosome biogenesis GTPase A n=1 Tax=Marinibactrum halimedae TaxID=1444977 RepID=A0AA37T9X7_9GAMM|nr:ribosome biogenesis GTPase YlqF [Marinibactrum halimedae]MCD9458803.1 ribosome biogenesis GTPase YlqF [Marinibactrum halimedae]GLS25362.1 ribosome biogenesis GTPase A [Marinibactrum halimedae]
MSINWYPGHMHKARKQMIEVLPKTDILIEILDARIPYSSENPAIAQLRGNKPCIKLLSKTDLADTEQTKTWQQYFESDQNVKTLAITTTDQTTTRTLPQLIKKLLPNKVAQQRTIHAMIVGIPNVGKSTLINTLAGRSAAKVGNEPAVTKSQQRIHLDDNIILNDTPGILWPNVENPHSGYRLAVTGAIKDTAIEYEDIALFACENLAQRYPEKLQERYGITIPSAIAGNDQALINMLEEIGKKRGALRAGGKVDLHKAAEAIIHDIRSGALGKLTFESPADREQEEKLVEKIRQEKAEKKRARKEAEQLKRSGKRHT